MAGWTVAVEKTTLAKPVKTDDGDVTEAVSKITWTATAGGLQPGRVRPLHHLGRPVADQAQQADVQGDPDLQQRRGRQLDPADREGRARARAPGPHAHPHRRRAATTTDSRPARLRDAGAGCGEMPPMSERATAPVRSARRRLHRRTRRADRPSPRRPRRRRREGRAARRFAGAPAGTGAQRRVARVRGAQRGQARASCSTSPAPERRRALPRPARALRRAGHVGRRSSRPASTRATSRARHPHLVVGALTPFGLDGPTPTGSRPAPRCRRPAASRSRPASPSARRSSRPATWSTTPRRSPSAFGLLCALVPARADRRGPVRRGGDQRGDRADRRLGAAQRDRADRSRVPRRRGAVRQRTDLPDLRLQGRLRAAHHPEHPPVARDARVAG